jgi:hypothetical protein
MSQLKVDTITDEAGTGSPSLPNGLTVGGVNYPSTGPLSNRNKIINGAMVIDQRNAGAAFTSLIAGLTYTLDRWQAVLTGAANTFSVQRNAGSVTPPAGFSNYLGVVSLAATTPAAGDFYQIKQLLEGFNVADLSYGTSAAQPVTVSFWVRSSLTGNFGLVITWGSTNANQRAYPVLYTISAANTWEYKTVTIPGDTTMAAGGFETSNNVGIQLRFSLGGGATNAGTPGAWATANSQTVVGDTSVVSTNGATWQITGVQLEAGTVATPFEHRSFGQELALCQRYCYVPSNAPSFSLAWVAGSLSFQGHSILHPQPMRASPTVSGVTSFTIQGITGSAVGFSFGPTQSYLSLGSNNSNSQGDGVLRSVNANQIPIISAEL